MDLRMITHEINEHTLDTYYMWDIYRYRRKQNKYNFSLVCLSAQLIVLFTFILISVAG